MARKRKKKAAAARGRRKAPGGASWRTHFGRTAKKCFAEGPTSGKMLGACMKREL